jgi:hypothetical protein
MKPLLGAVTTRFSDDDCRENPCGMVPALLKPRANAGVTAWLGLIERNLAEESTNAHGKIQT